MPTSGARGHVKRSAFRLRGKSARSVDGESNGSPSECGEFLHIGPALAGNCNQSAQILPKRTLGPRAHSTLGSCHLKNGKNESNSPAAPVQGLADGQMQISRTQKEKEKFVDRISLDRRGLSCIPTVLGEPGLRLLSLQHNLLNSLSGLNLTADFSNLVFLDVYDNQIDKISSLEILSSLRVLLMGKNRIRRIEGLSCVTKLEVLDLHGNRITHATGLKGLNELKVLNLAGNQLRSVDLSGLPELREMNLKRNRLRKLVGCEGAPKIQKLFLSNNDLQSIDDISSIALALSLREVTLDNNPIALGGDCVSFLVSYLPNLCFLSQMQVTEQVRRAAMAWRHNKESSIAIFNELGEEADPNSRREQIISNARANWELLRSQNKCLSSTLNYANIGLTSEYAYETNNTAKNDVPDLFKNNTLAQINKPPNNKLSNLNLKAHQDKQNIGYRSTSQDTDISHSTSTSSELKLPPILVPIIDSLEHQKISLINDPAAAETPNPKYMKRWESISSVDPVLNSSMSSLLTTTSDSESDVSKKVTNKRQILTANKKRATFATSKSVSISDANPSSIKSWTKNRSISDNSENMSVVSNGTNMNSIITNSSTSGSDAANKTRKEASSRAGSSKGRHIKSATTIRRNLAKQNQNRAVTAKSKNGKNVVGESTNGNVNVPPESVVKDREQGSDWLVEVRGGQASVWGAGALRRLEKSWPSANDVTTIHFHYVSFGNICGVLSTIKNRFPNAVNMTFRACGISCIGQLGALAALRGISSLSINKDGNPLAGQGWHSYALYRLAHWGLCALDQEQVTDEAITSANDEYSGLSEVVLWSLPDSLLQPLLLRLQGEKDNNFKQQFEKDSCKNIMFKDGYKKDNLCVKLDKDLCCNESESELIKYGTARCWLWNADATLRDVVAKEALQWRRSPMSQEEVVLRHRGRAHLSKVLGLAAGAALKLRMFRRQWPAILLHLITTIMYDYSKIQAHIDEKMKELHLEMCAEGQKKSI